MLYTILLALLAGAIIGPLARLVLPGRQNISTLMTVILGALGGLIGSWIFYTVTGKSDTSGIDWISLIIGVVVAAALILIYGSLRGRRV
ncbi:MAG TPA: GlsB/YeaQ/YmgE family stress response membrane protein [Dermatophilaceae bacterium]|nr:GlsB/YeaQ/YmgE family stress response membrane protein [Dermatophilaceae bacterium]